ncbi:hypothetical protein [Actinomadura harenae]|uniref:hypothetical protein n=1 Tax=Actinomadura harenae TaxID=2483351 RepID=UPI0013157AD0|nr:hypothetical protein [Actinomadura harenae]
MGGITASLLNRVTLEKTRTLAPGTRTGAEEVCWCVVKIKPHSGEGMPRIEPFSFSINV